MAFPKYHPNRDGCGAQHMIFSILPPPPFRRGQNVGGTLQGRGSQGVQRDGLMVYRSTPGTVAIGAGAQGRSWPSA